MGYICIDVTWFFPQIRIERYNLNRGVVANITLRLKHV